MKRTISGVVGILAASAGVVLLIRVARIALDLHRSDVPRSETITGLSVAVGLALLAYIEAYRFLKFALTGRTRSSNSVELSAKG